MFHGTDERTFEAHIQKALAGICTEELNENLGEEIEPYKTGRGYWYGYHTDYDPQYAIDRVRFWHFLENTQSEELDKLRDQSQWQLMILQRLDRMIKKYGIIHVLRRGLELDDAKLTFLYEYPPVNSSPEVKKRFESNQFSVTRQVNYSLANPREEIDMVIFINGLPVITMELKNHWTLQNARHNGQKQYESRDHQQPLLQFGRCVVHMAVDTEEIYMTTRLEGKATQFRPFNKGNEQHGAGNPVNPAGGHKTAYLWDEILLPASLANILQHFVILDGKSSDRLETRTLFFPRYHQLNTVRKIVDHVTNFGVGHTYLIQHSAGSGKSNSITWAAFQLIEVYPASADLPGARATDKPLFDSVIVVTDRTILDKQIRSNIKDFSEVKNIVAPAVKSKDLRDAMESGKRIIITTIQKFPHILNDISDMSEKRFAVIIDEAHSSHSGRAHDKMNQSMGMGTDQEEEMDAQDIIVATMNARKMKGNASYMAFTATPKPITIEKFGTLRPDGTMGEFDLYSMKQAIQERFILDVLSNYTTNSSYYELQKSIEDNPLFDTVKAQKALKAYVERDPKTIEVKARIMIDHFMQNVVGKNKLKGKAKAMVLTQSIESAIKYYFAIRKLLEDKGARYKAIVAFTGKKTYQGIEYTEDSINDLPEHLDTGKPTDHGYISDRLARNFDMDEYKILIVANKYLTGFDQPKLTAMYIDKKLQGVLAVQALSRLNRSAQKWGKRTQDIMVVDFFNSTAEIKKAFDPYYTVTTLSETTDVNVLHELKALLDEPGVYEWREVEEFNELFWTKQDATVFNKYIEIAQRRFESELGLEEKEKADFKIKAKQFVKIYGQMASIMPGQVVRWEKLYWFLSLLIPKLAVKLPQDDGLEDLLSSVDLSSYGLEQTKLNEQIILDDEEEQLDPQNPNPRGAHDNTTEEDELDAIIRVFNDRFFAGWDATPEERRLKFRNFLSGVGSTQDFKEKVADNPDHFNAELALKKLFEEQLRKQRKTDLDFYKILAQDETAKRAFYETMKQALGLRF